jgi:hypothetical protein
VKIWVGVDKKTKKITYTGSLGFKKKDLYLYPNEKAVRAELILPEKK